MPIITINTRLLAVVPMSSTDSTCVTNPTSNSRTITKEKKNRAYIVKKATR